MKKILYYIKYYTLNKTFNNELIQPVGKKKFNRKLLEPFLKR